MAKLAIFLADGCEEVEALATVDVCRRAKFEINLISITGSLEIHGSRGIVFMAEKLIEDTDFSAYDGVILPGGMPGTTNLGACDAVIKQIKEFNAADKLVAAICAAPSVLGDNDILVGKDATCHPGFEERLKGANVKFDNAVISKNTVTSRGMGTAVDFGLAIVKYFEGQEAVDKVKVGLAI